MSGEGLPISASADSSLDAFNDVELAREGVTHLLNNEWDKAEELFRKYKEDSPLMCAGDSMVTFMQALMSFEEEQLQEAMKALQDCQRKCETSDSVFKTIRNKLRRKKAKLYAVEDKLQRQIIVADCILYQAVLTFLNQDIPSYIKGGWLLRKAYKQYERLHKDIKKLYKKSQQQNSTPVHLETVSNSVEDEVDEDVTAKDSTDVWQRLLGAVSFGYGAFQLAISLVPPKILKVIELLGFDGDREKGLSALAVSGKSQDMKAPLASLGLIWYHTVIRPFFALDGAAVDAGVPEAYRLIEECKDQYPSSSLFLFFKGRAQRLESKLEEALTTYHSSLEASHGQREVKLICYHEIGWIEMMLLNFENCAKYYIKLKENSRWSKAYYAYLSGLCYGAAGKLEDCQKLLGEIPELIRRKNNQIEAYVQHRSEFLQTLSPSPDICELLILEVLYLWNTLSQCTLIDKMLATCREIQDKRVQHISFLIQGALLDQLGQNEEAQSSFQQAIDTCPKTKESLHIAAYALYELGLYLLAEPGKMDRGRETLIRARDHYKDYEFDNRLSVRINSALRRAKEDDGTAL